MAYHKNTSLVLKKCSLKLILCIYIKMVSRLIKYKYVRLPVYKLTKSYLSLFTTA